ncbi:MAG: DUF4143 domain-containing protein [Betaproteobacteria bacterium]|nr:DUF4143 domain-containing protein [Betaproteobacteria bacterium]
MDDPADLTSTNWLPRHAEQPVARALADTRIVAIVGPRQSGKTTLARRIAATDGRAFISLDDEHALQFAREDSAGFLRRYDFAVIDELQRAPNLILPLKKSVDENRRPGRYLVTGSADLFGTASAPDSLLGRIEMIELLPFSQAEIRRAPPPGFLSRAFAGDFPNWQPTGFSGNLTAMIIAGGYPEILAAKNNRRRQKLLAWAAQAARHDLPELGQLRKMPETLSDFIKAAAAASGQMANMARLAAAADIDRKSARNWLLLLERMFLLQRVRSWQRNSARSLVKTPKVHFLDSAMLAALQDASPARLAAERNRIGCLLEAFVFAELRKAQPHCPLSLRIYHYRDQDGYEVDFVLEADDGRTVGIEVKAAVGASPRDFRGLRRLAEQIGDRFVCGILLHDGERIFKTGERMFAMPVKMLWEA